MKNLIIIGLVALFPLQVFAYDAMTKEETPDFITVSDNREAILKMFQRNYCVTEKEQVEKKISDLRAIGYITYDISSQIDYYEQQRRSLESMCNDAKKLDNTPFSSNTWAKSVVSCSDGTISRGNMCITPTEACQYYFGSNMTGLPHKGWPGMADCTCNDGYVFSNNACVVKPKPTPTVLGVSTVSSDQQLKDMIVQLTTVLNSLLQQLNARMGR